MAFVLASTSSNVFLACEGLEIRLAVISHASRNKLAINLTMILTLDAVMLWWYCCIILSNLGLVRAGRAVERKFTHRIQS